MWVAKIKAEAARGFFGPFAMKHKVTVSGYTLRYWKKGKKLFVLGAGQILGPEKNRNAFIKDLYDSGNLLKYEVSGDFMIAVFPSFAYNEPLYQPDVILLKPVVIRPDGQQFFEIASWKKESLMRVIRILQKYSGGKVLKLAQEKVGHISIVSMLPELTQKQRRALELAVEHGYYEYPRKVQLKELARMMKLSYATYHAHLRKAERVLLPFMFARFK